VSTDRRSTKRKPVAAANNGTRKATRHQLPPASAVGWEAYRGWLGKLDRNGAKRQGPDSVYTWKGYKAWSARVRAQWDQETD
jgi:hypothetical protein